MAMAPAATRAPPRLLSKSSFLVPSPNATAATTVRLARRAGGNRNVLLGAAPRSGRRGGWDADSNSSSVDEDMATLQRRIRETRAALSEDDIDNGTDAGVGLPPPAEWTELEQRHHWSYMAGVRGAAGLLQAFLVNARPGLGAGVVALLLLGLPASLFLVCAQLITAVDSLSSAGLNGPWLAK
ncbi:uncharacterized protein LOC133929230 [Phragmites australis]|uniref:uncharacterized protein LOC133929230 n=1 Tax=Phragmites australis TaxID=29695 RepID=UPI002D76BC09|nr:uncharacterized protein LOC133929230 [Phragmites australis]